MFAFISPLPPPSPSPPLQDAGGGTGGGATLTAKLRYMRSARFALRKYVLQNTFVGAHADWAFNIEDLSSPELCVELCENCGLGAIPRSGGATGCPTASEFKDIIDNKMKTDANHDHTHHSAWTWEALFDVDPDFTTAALMLGESYGYETKHLEPVQGFKIICGTLYLRTHASCTMHHAQCRHISMHLCIHVGGLKCGKVVPLSISSILMHESFAARRRSLSSFSALFFGGNLLFLSAPPPSHLYSHAACGRLCRRRRPWWGAPVVGLPAGPWVWRRWGCVGPDDDAPKAFYASFCQNEGGQQVERGRSVQLGG